MSDTRRRKIKPFSATWERYANVLARDFAPPIYPCQKCSYPYISVYGCTWAAT